MHKPKSKRHARAANARWRAAEMHAQAERDSGILDRLSIFESRQVIELDLRNWGGKHWRFEPREGYISARRIDLENGKVVDCAAIKTLLRRVADLLAPRLGLRQLGSGR
jgi:hypothetical protein